MKDKNLALKTAGVVFLLVAIVHLLRLFLRVNIFISGHRVTFVVSWLGFIFALLLGLWMYTASKD
jgi:hypothetical protein